MKLLRKRLLAWYRKNRRALPWRKTKDPYRIAVSEVMLQQTRVETVVPYYRRFVKRFPTVTTLAEVKEDSVLKAWEGLGYYGRARNLHATANEIVERYGAGFPSSSRELNALPGFGPYTSAAVASIAFKEPVACVDGNVRRVLSRLFGITEGIPETAQRIVDPKNPGDFNQAVMELGALICLPKNPRCEICPLFENCVARKKNRVHRFPPPLAKKNVKKIFAVTLVVRGRDRVWVIRRPKKGCFAGMWEFPTLEEWKPIPIDPALEKLAAAGNLTLKNVTPAGTFRHQLSHRTIFTTVFRAQREERGGPNNGRWVTFSGLGELALSRLQREALRLAFPKASRMRAARSSSNRPRSF